MARKSRKKVVRNSSRKSTTRAASKKRVSRNRDAQEISLRVLAAVRRGAALSRALKQNGTTSRTVKRYVGAALVQDRPGGRIRATKSDQFVRYLSIPGPHGPIEITVRGSKAATQVAKYKASVSRFLRGDKDAMAPWHGKKIAGVELITNGSTLKSLADKGLLPYSLYRSFAGGGR